jgi:hypothetical protein
MAARGSGLSPFETLGAQGRAELLRVTVQETAFVRQYC